MSKLIFLSEGFRMLKRKIAVSLHGIPKYSGDDKEICRQIIERCYNEKKCYFQTSAGHFCQFYTRDFAWVVSALIKLGHKNRVRNTLSYALSKFKQYGHIATAISPSGKAFDFPNYSLDSLPYLLYSLSELGDKKIIEEYKLFLEQEIFYFLTIAVEIKTGLPKRRNFSSIRDHANRLQCCYDVCMLYLMQKSCDELGLSNPLKKYDYKDIILRKYWTGLHFSESLDNRCLTADSNIFPFWTGLIDDKKILRKAIASMLKSDMDKPFPLKYNSSDAKISLNMADLLASGYEKDTIWMHIGMLFLLVVGMSDLAMQKYYLKQYKQLIISYQNFLEVFFQNSRPYSSLFYFSDDSMVWCANYLVLIKS